MLSRFNGHPFTFPNNRRVSLIMFSFDCTVERAYSLELIFFYSKLFFFKIQNCYGCWTESDNSVLLSV